MKPLRWRMGRSAMLYRMHGLSWVSGFFLMVLVPALDGVQAQQVADSAYTPPILNPAYAEGEGPVVLIDEAHSNYHTAEGRYLTFARLLKRDGYVVKGSGSPFTPETLREGEILVISNALAEKDVAVSEWALPTAPAFAAAEVTAVRKWVREGGALMLIADHMPMPGAAAELAAAFGVFFNNGFAMRDGGRSGQITFRRSDGTLVDHPVTRGRDPSETVDSVVTFTGQAFRAGGEVEPILVVPAGIDLLMPVVAWEFSDETPRLSAEGMFQGAVLRFGAGRVAVFGEAAMFSAQLGGAQRLPLGMNAPQAAQNYQFLLNVVHWLSGLLD